MTNRDDYGLASDAQGYAFWAVVTICFTMPVWLPVACFFAGAIFAGTVLGGG